MLLVHHRSKNIQIMPTPSAEEHTSLTSKTHLLNTEHTLKAYARFDICLGFLDHTIKVDHISSNST